jgi:hypothetical protein
MDLIMIKMISSDNIKIIFCGHYQRQMNKSGL